jgi:hypothetical protein
MIEKKVAWEYLREVEPFSGSQRLISMSSAQRASYDQLRGNYRRAFAEFTQKVHQTRALMAAPNPDWQAIDAALLELERAHVNYNRHRDLIAQQLLKQPMASGSVQPAADRVKAVAQLRWELAGKPEGTADDDWYRAEEIVRRAMAA